MTGTQTRINALQGDWGDDIGLTIKISGRTAQFSDGTPQWTIEEADDGILVLRGARFVGTVEAPVWEFPTGLQRHWARVTAAGSGDVAWARAFLRFKAERLELRRRLQSALSTLDLEKAATLKAAWEHSSATPVGLTEEQSLALLNGQRLVSGMCFRHKKFDYRGIILGHDPWCTYPASWRAKWLPDRPRGEVQAFYHCLVDERDRPGNHSRYVAEENIELCDLVFPIEAPLADALLVRCDEIGGYLPGARLEAALHRQQGGARFAL